MPSKRTIALILFFWLLTTGYVAYRDVWPRLFASGPPQVTIDLSDEAAQTSIPVRWTIYRGDQKVGSLVSHLHYVKTDDTFEFKSEYKQLVLEVAMVKCVVPELTTYDRITRGGNLLKQSMDGKFDGYLGGHKFAEAEAHIQGTVTDGQLTGECVLDLSLGSIKLEKIKEPLDPVPVPAGQPLNPLLPVNRLTDIKPGRSWHVQMSSPLEEAVDRVIRKQMEKNGFKRPVKDRGSLFAQVQQDARDLSWFGETIPCWVIEYSLENPVAQTWVRVSDGKVMKQEAFFEGEHMTILRDK